MIKIFDKRKVVNVKFPLTDEERQIIADLVLMGYNANKVETMKIRQENPQAIKIKKDDVKKYLDKKLQKEFFANTKLVSLDEHGNPKYMKNGKPQRIGFFGALRKLEKDHKEAYKKMISDLKAAKEAAQNAAEAEKEVENIDTDNITDLKVVA